VPHGGVRLDPISVRELHVSAKALIVVLLVVIVVVGATGGESSAAAIGSAIGEAVNLVQVAWNAMIDRT
jgi:Sec-independent protein translocase protein TatA